MRIAAIVAVLTAGGLLASWILRTQPSAPDPESHRAGEAAHTHESDAREGPHGGRLLESDGLSAEVTISEKGIPPELRLYFYEDGRLIDPSEVAARVSLARVGGESDSFAFRPEGEFLRSVTSVEEPHSFDVRLEATWRGETHRWTFASYEGRVELSAEAAERAGIRIETVAAAKLATRLRLNGLIAPNEDRLAHVLPRFAGVVREVRKHVGDPVAKGEVLAVVQSNQSLQSYEVRSEIGGTVIQKHVTPGEYVAEGDHLYTVADLDTVWIDLNVYRQDFPRVAVGQPVLLDAGEGLPAVEGRIDYLSPFGSASTQTMLARVVQPNPDRSLRPGFFVTGEVIVDQATVPVAVRRSALQTLGNGDVVFLKEGDVYQAQPVEVGRRDDEWVEIVSGLRDGQRYVARGSFVLKADLGKSGAGHEH